MIREEGGDLMEQVVMAGSSTGRSNGSEGTNLRQNYPALGALMDGGAGAPVDSPEQEQRTIASLRQVLADMQGSLNTEDGR